MCIPRIVLNWGLHKSLKHQSVTAVRRRASLSLGESLHERYGRSPVMRQRPRPAPMLPVPIDRFKTATIQLVSRLVLTDSCPTGRLLCPVCMHFCCKEVDGLLLSIIIIIIINWTGGWSEDSQIRSFGTDRSPVSTDRSGDTWPGESVIDRFLFGAGPQDRVHFRRQPRAQLFVPAHLDHNSAL